MMLAAIIYLILLSIAQLLLIWFLCMGANIDRKKLDGYKSSLELAEERNEALSRNVDGLRRLLLARASIGSYESRDCPNGRAFYVTWDCDIEDVGDGETKAYCTENQALNEAIGMFCRRD